MSREFAWDIERRRKILFWWLWNPQRAIYKYRGIWWRHSIATIIIIIITIVLIVTITSKFWALAPHRRGQIQSREAKCAACKWLCAAVGRALSSECCQCTKDMMNIMHVIMMRRNQTNCSIDCLGLALTSVICAQKIQSTPSNSTGSSVSRTTWHFWFGTLWSLEPVTFYSSLTNPDMTKMASQKVFWNVCIWRFW